MTMTADEIRRYGWLGVNPIETVLTVSPSILLHGDGVDGSTTFTDSSPAARTVTTQGNAQIDTAQSKFGGGSMLFDGTGDYATATIAAALGAGDYTVAGWIRLNAQTNRGWFQLSTSHLPGAHSGIAMGYDGANVYVDAGGSAFSTAKILSNGVWYHFEASRSGTTLKTFIDGVPLHSVTDSVNHSGVSLVVGGWFSSSFLLDGWLEDFIVLKGQCLHVAAFTPPAAPYSNSVTPSKYGVKRL